MGGRLLNDAQTNDTCILSVVMQEEMNVRVVREEAVRLTSVTNHLYGSRKRLVLWKQQSPRHQMHLGTELCRATAAAQEVRRQLSCHP